MVDDCQVAMIWAMSRNRVIGRDNTLPWRLPDDMKHFMKTTMGKPVVMGRKTLESMKAPLPGRTNLVVTRQPDWTREGVVACLTLEDALERAAAQCAVDGQQEIMVIGGAQIYELALPLADRLYVTHVHAEVDGDVFFPEYNEEDWQCVYSQDHQADERNTIDFTIAIYDRR